MRLLSILTLLLLGAAGCNLANVAQGPTEVMLLFTYPVDQIPDQVNLELKDADGEVLAEIAVPQMPKVFSSKGQESVGLRMNAEWSGLGRLTFEAQATREDTVILTGDASFELKRGTVNDAILNLALPTELSLDGGTIPQDADGGNATPTLTEDAGSVVEPPVDGGSSTQPMLDGGTITEPNGDGGTITPECPECGANASCDPATLECSCDNGYKPDTTGTCILACGDGVIDEGEGCDDANSNLPGCSDACVIEEGYSCSGAPSICEPGCGDGLIVGTEACDDSNDDDNDGCASCAVTAGWLCDGSPSVCVTQCGDNIVAGQEACDNGNTDGDGCSSGCTLEPGWQCQGSPSLCTAAACGDGYVVADEACDDNNMDDGDGCASCSIERGWVCDSEEPTSCESVCGDGIIVGFEACDNISLASIEGDDGCSNDTCEVQLGWYCEGEPSICETRCGDNIVAGGEICDEGPGGGVDATGQTCAADCTYEEPSDCGNGVLDEGEACEGTDFGGLSCGSFGLREPNTTATALTCSSLCEIETVECNGTIAPANGSNITNRLQSAVNNELNQIIRLSPPAIEPGGLRLDFYNIPTVGNINDDDFLGSSIVGPINLDENLVADYASGQSEEVYIVGQGLLKIPGDGIVSDLQLRTISDDGIRVYLDLNGADNELVIDNFTYHGATADDSGFISAQGGRLIPIRIDFFQGIGSLVLGLYWRAPSLGVNDWVLIPAENLLSGGGTWLINDTINIDRSNDLIIEAANAEEGLTFQAPEDEPVFEIDSRGQTGDVVLRNFTIENVQEGIDIESDGTSEGFVIIDGLSIEGRFNEGGSFDRLDYAIRAEEGRPNLIIVNNTITAPSESLQFGGQGIFVYSNCGFVGFNVLKGNFSPAILLNVDQTTSADCDFSPAVDNNTVHLNVDGNQEGIWLSGNTIAARNNLVYKGEYDTAFGLRNMLVSSVSAPMASNYVGIDTGFCLNSCQLRNVCDNYDGCGNSGNGCCNNYCDEDEAGSGCLSAFPNLTGLSALGCPQSSGSFTWIDKGTTLAYPDSIQSLIPAVDGDFRDVGAREQNVPFSVGGQSDVCTD